MAHATNAPTRPGILNVFWPAFLGWGAAAGVVGALRLSMEPGSPWSWPVEILFWPLVLKVALAPIGAFVATVRICGARHWFAILTNATTLVLSYYAVKLMIFVHRANAIAEETLRRLEG